MKIIEYLKFVGDILMCQIVAPIEYLDLPSIRKITVQSVTTSEGRSSDIIAHVSTNGTTRLVTTLPETPGKKTTIVLKDIYGGGSILLDHFDDSIDSFSSNHWYTSNRYTGSGDIGIMLLGLPGILLATPLLIINALISMLIHTVTGMDKHALSFYLRIRNQLDNDVRLLLKRALMNQ